jgi:hypothetical protein
LIGEAFDELALYWRVVWSEYLWFTGAECDGVFIVVSEKLALVG